MVLFCPILDPCSFCLAFVIQDEPCSSLHVPLCWLKCIDVVAPWVLLGILDMGRYVGNGFLMAHFLSSSSVLLNDSSCAPRLVPAWCSLSKRNATWLILPVVICLSQRLSHACVSMNKFRLWNCEWLIKSVIVCLMVSATRITVVILELIRATNPDFWKGCIY